MPPSRSAERKMRNSFTLDAMKINEAQGVTVSFGPRLPEDKYGMFAERDPAVQCLLM